MTRERIKKIAANSKTLFPKFINALKERYQQVLKVIDDALESESLKDRIWAVEQILKRTKPENTEENNQTKISQAGKTNICMSQKQLEKMSEKELAKILQDFLLNE